MADERIKGGKHVRKLCRVQASQLKETCNRDWHWKVWERVRKTREKQNVIIKVNTSRHLYKEKRKI